MFRAGDTVLHPGYGVCKIESVQKDKYVLRPKIHIPGDVKILISKEKIKDAGVHYPIKKNKISHILQILSSEPNARSEDRSKGYPLIKKVIHSGDLYKTAAAVRDLTNNQNSNSYSSTGEDLLKSAREILIIELAHVKRVSRDKIERKLDIALNKKSKKALSMTLLNKEQKNF